MKICYVINSLDGGGGALPLPNVIGVMRAAGHEVAVVSLMERDGRARPALDAAGIPYTVIGGPKRRFVSTAFRLAGIVRRTRPDVLWTSLSHATITGQLLGPMLGVPVVSWLHNAWLKPGNIRVMRRTKGLTRHWVADSDTVASFGVETLGIDRSKMSIWPLFRADPMQPVATAASGVPFVLGSLGRLHPNKGYHVLIEALSLLRARSPQLAQSLLVRIAGEGPIRGELEKLAADRGVSNLEFVGFTEPGRFLAGLHCYVQPSHHEGFCIAAHEAMLAGLPVIASPVGEMARSIRAADGGVLVDFGNAGELASAIGRYASDPALASRTGAAGRDWVARQFSAAAFSARGLAAMEAAGVVSGK